LLKPFVVPYTLVPVLFSGSLLVEGLEKGLPGQMYGRRLLPRWSSTSAASPSASSGFEGNTARVEEEPHLFDLFHLIVPGWLRRMVTRDENSVVSKAVEQRRWIEMRNYIVVRLSLVPRYLSIFSLVCKAQDLRILTFDRFS